MKNRQDFHLLRFIFYCVTYMMVGCIFFGFGPLIPYYMALRHRTVQDYTIVMIGRVVGYIIGNILATSVDQCILTHQILAVGLTITGVFLIAFNQIESTLIFEAITFGITTIGIIFIDINAKIGVIYSSKKNCESQLEILHSFIAVGGFFVCIIVYLIGLWTYLVLGIACLFFAIIFGFFLESPEHDPVQQQDQTAEQQEIQKEENEDNQNSGRKSRKFKIIMILLCLSVFADINIETTYGTWISAYAVTRKLATKQSATLYTLLYWSSIIIFRYFFSFVGGKASIKVVIASLSGLLISIGAFSLINEINSSLIIIIASICIGFFIAPIFVLLLEISKQFGISLSKNNIKFMLFSACCGDGVISVPLGFLGKSLTLQILFRTISVCFCIIFIISIVILIFLCFHQQDQKLQVEHYGLEKQRQLIQINI